MSAVLRKILPPVAIALALAFLYFTVMVKLANDWWHDENYSHGLLIPFVIAFILWPGRRSFVASPSARSAWLGAIGIGVALFALWAGTAGAELFMQRVSLVLMLAGIVIYFFGARLMRFVAVPLVLLMLSIPIPQIIFNRIAFPLQLFASRCAVAAMSFFSIPVLRQGNVIELMPFGASEPKKLAVVEACSGIRSLMTLVTLAVIYAYFTRPRPGSTNFNLSSPVIGDPEMASDKLRFVGHFGFWRALILVVAAVPIAILTNALRVSGTGVLAHYYGTRVADGFFHTFSGWVIYVAAALLLLGTGWVLDRIALIGKNKTSNSLEGGLPPAWPGSNPTLTNVGN
ncbi:MAG: exosortase [Pyrinomonadaceae bacterium]